MLAWLAAAEFLAMTMWFSATAAAPGLRREFGVAEGAAAWLTMAVQAGFVVGALVSALVNLADIVPPRRLFAAGAVAGALANLAVTFSTNAPAAVWWRFVTGAALASVYPPGMKIAAGWFLAGRGTALGIVVAALTAGSAFPHLLAALSLVIAWRWLVGWSSICAVIAAGIILTRVQDGPYVSTTAPFDPRAILLVFRNRAARLATFGYLGHMWELYAMWTWMAVFAGRSLAAAGTSSAVTRGSLAAFVAIALGALGCGGAGLIADRVGKARVASWAMIVSGACSVVAGLVFAAPPAVLFALAAIWGISIVADSALFSALVTEHCPPHHVGTALTIQMCSGFLLTMISIRLIPAIAEFAGWRWAFLVLAPGPLIGAWVMLRLQRDERVESVEETPTSLEGTT